MHLMAYSPEMGLYLVEAEGQDARKGPEKGVQQHGTRGGAGGAARRMVGGRHGWWGWRHEWWRADIRSGGMKRVVAA